MEFLSVDGPSVPAAPRRRKKTLPDRHRSTPHTGLTLLAVGVAACLCSCGKPPSPLAPYETELSGLTPDSATVLALSARPDLMDAAGRVFRATCASCHTAAGTGLVGPNLTDDAYLNVRTPADFYEVISDGRHAKGMPAWDRSFSAGSRLALAAYVASLRGSAPGKGKEPEGEVIPPWNEALPTGGE